MDLLSTFTDDQVALFGCAAAFVGAMFLMTISYYIGKRGQEQRATRERILSAASRTGESLDKAA